MRVMLMGQHYAPEEISGSVLGTELATDLTKMGYEVAFVTCAPNYPTGKVYPGYRNRLLSRETTDGVKVIRTWSYISPHKSFWHRILNYGSFSVTALFGGMAAGRPDILLSFSPPLPLCVAAWLLSRLWRIPWILNVEDIYPEIAVVTGVLRNRPAIAFFSAMERFFYRKATHIQVLSEGFRQNLLAKGVPPEKLSITPVWADPDGVRPMPKENAFREQHGLSGKFVVMYAGNFGYNSSLEDVIEAADLMKTEKDIRFVLIGEGVKKEELISLVEHKALKNLVILPFQPRSAYEAMMAAADISLVTLSPDAHHTSLPSKTFNIMSSGRPILVVTPENSEIANLVQDAHCGIAISPGRPAELAQAILDLKKDVPRLAAMGANGRQRLEEQYSRQRCIKLFDEDFQRMVKEAP